jgi:glycosyltransferase involved in cell wall biosynthesis
MNVCTIIAKNYVAHARVLARSFREQHPDGTCTVLVVDDYEGFLDPAEEPFEILGIEEIGLPDPEGMAASYDVTEFSTAVKPWLLRELLGRDGVDAVTYLDPDILVTDSLTPIEERAVAEGIVLTPHFTAPLPRDGGKPCEEDILIAGSYNLGFISLGAGDTAAEMLNWWSERLERDCVIDPGAGLFVDQRWIDLVPGIWPGVHVLRDSGYNVAYWNLPTRELEIDDDGYLVDGRPLRFFHFSGFDPLRPTELSKHQDRIEVADDPALKKICAEYAELLLENGQREARGWSYGWSSLPNGVRLDDPARRVHREAVEQGDLEESIFTSSGAAEFVSYLREKLPGTGTSRYGKALWDLRTDLRRAFPNVERGEGTAFNRWLIESARESGISVELIPAPESSVQPSSNGSGPHMPPAVNLAGYLGSELGVGEAARQLAAALRARELPFTEIDVPEEESRLGEELGGIDRSDHPHDVNLLCVNADMLPAVSRSLPSEFFRRRHTAGLWFWEVEQFPERWHGSFKYLDEVWAASEFVAEALRTAAPIPVSTIRVPVTPVEPADLDREALSMPEGFCFLFVFDLRSVLRRKNPLGTIEAFRRAFEPGEGATLLLKTVGSEQCPEDAAELAAAAAEHPDVHVLDGVLPAAEKNALIAACNCYVSLHRSEGLGLTMAEAMYFGKPVIATAYSGNLDFMTDDNAYLVDYELAQIGSGAAPYPPGARWAEPSLEHAAELMRRVFDERKEAARKGERAAAAIRATHSPEAAGKVLEERLAELHRRNVMAHAPPPPPADALAATVPAVPLYADPAGGMAMVHHLLEFDQAPARKGAGRLRAFFKRLYMRVLRPYADYQRRIDVSMSEAVDQLSFQLASMERRLAALDGDVRGACTVQADELEELTEAVERLRSERGDYPIGSDSRRR